MKLSQIIDTYRHSTIEIELSKVRAVQSERGMPLERETLDSPV
jgi:hypothetical protein